MIVKKIETEILIYQYDELTEDYKLLIDKAKKQTQNSYAPYSKFKVGAAVKLANGEIIEANNQENIAYPSGLCAERVAIFYSNSKYPEIPVNTIAVAAYSDGKFTSEPISPCGSCRQVLLESEIRYKKNITILLYGEKFIYVIKSVRNILALAFDNIS